MYKTCKLEQTSHTRRRGCTFTSANGVRLVISGVLASQQLITELGSHRLIGVLASQPSPGKLSTVSMMISIRSSPPMVGNGSVVFLTGSISVRGEFLGCVKKRETTGELDKEKC